jgi:hypothetical protein
MPNIGWPELLIVGVVFAIIAGTIAARSGSNLWPWGRLAESAAGVLGRASAANTSPAISAAVPLQRRKGVRVGVEGDRDGGGAQALGDNLGMHAGVQRQGGVCATVVLTGSGGEEDPGRAFTQRRKEGEGCLK